MAERLKRAIDTFWKIYFWVLFILMLTGFANLGLNKIWLIIDLLFSVAAFVGLFSYAYKRKVLNSISWKIFFPILLIWHFLYFGFIFPQIIEPDCTIIQLVICILLWMPFYIALYLYAFRFFKSDKNI